MREIWFSLLYVECHSLYQQNIDVSEKENINKRAWYDYKLFCNIEVHDVSSHTSYTLISHHPHGIGSPNS